MEQNNQEVVITEDQWYTRTKDKCCIVGCADTKNIVPFADDSFEFWGVNNLYVTNLPGSRYHRWFEIHNLEKRGNIFYRREKPDFRGQTVNAYLEGLAKLPVVLYMQRKWDELPNSVPYPIQDVINMLGNYFTNTISYEIALAIMMGFKEIHIYGVDMSVGCLSPDTRVLTSDLRWVKSSDIQIGDELMAFDEESSNGNGKTRRWRKTVVTKCPEIMRPCYKIYLEDGTEFIASEKHGWLTHGENYNRWKTTEQLMTKYHRSGKPTRILKLLDVWENDNSWEAGYLAGALDGEGHLSQNPRKDHKGSNHMALGFAQKKNRMHEKVGNILGKYGYSFSTHQEKESDTDKFHIKGGKPELMRLLGQVRPQRLLSQFNPEIVGEMQRIKDVAVIGMEHIGMQPVIGLETEEKTYIAEGFASHNSEYGHQRPSCEYFIGYAIAKGIPIVIPDEADLLKTRFLYGFGEPKQNAFAKKLKKIHEEVHQRAIGAKNLADQQMAMFHQYQGSLQTLNEMQKIWSNLMDEFK